jgi:hypothetical protein
VVNVEALPTRGFGMRTPGDRRAGVRREQLHGAGLFVDAPLHRVGYLVEV